MKRFILLSFALAILGLSHNLMAQQTLNNDNIIKLVKAGLSDDLIVSSITTEAGNYNTTTDGIIALKHAGVSDRIVATLLAKNAPTPAPTIPIPAPVMPKSVQIVPIVDRSQIKPGAIFIKGDPDFAVAISAAMRRKEVPATIVLEEKNAEFILQSSSVAVQTESGLSKLARCAFAYCAGIGGSTNVSVELVRVDDSAVVWAYQVKKGNSGSHGAQSMSEAIAKHLKNEYFKKN
jgi:hypothetical protein